MLLCSRVTLDIADSILALLTFPLPRVYDETLDPPLWEDLEQYDVL